ncbi:uncharacterized protein [Dermacentor albipictus]|uniref:uncharacterized protein n=1 Tax=Dermacentor albipictus TaxID=60249 RepID=UPI0031FDF33E
MAMKNTSPASLTNSSSSQRVLARGSNPSARPARQHSKRKHKHKSSKSRSDKGAKRTKFFSPHMSQGRRHRRRPSSATSASQLQFCPHRQGSQFPTGRHPGVSRNHPLLVPSLSSFYPPGAAPLAPGTPVSIPGLPPLIAGNPVPLPPGFFPPFMGLAPPSGFGGPMMVGGGGGGGAQQPIVLPFPIPMPMPMPTSGGSHPPIVIPAPPSPPSYPPPYPSPMPYPVSAPAAQGGGGGSDTMALMMMMKSMQQERQAAAQERERDEERHQEEKREAEKRQHKKEKEEEKKRRKKEKEEERKRKKEEREKALEERKKEIERMQEENRRQIEEAQKAVEEAAAKKKAEKAEAMAKKAAEQEEAKKKKEEEEKAKQEAEAAAAAADAEKEAASAAETHHKSAGEERPLLGIEGPPDPMPYYAPPTNLPAFDPGADINPALQITEPRSTGRLLCFIVLFLIVFLAIVVALLYFFAPHLLPFLGTGDATTAAGAIETHSESLARGEVINVENPPIKRGKGAPGAPVTTLSSSARALTANAGSSTRARTESTAAPLDANTLEIALNDRQWPGAPYWDDGRLTDSATASSAQPKRTPDSTPFPSAFPPPGAASSNGVVPAKDPRAASSRRPRWRPELGNQSDSAVLSATALAHDAFLDQGYRQNLKARLFSEDNDGADKKAASRKRPTFDYDDIWNEDGGDEKAATMFTFEGITKSAIRELLESVQRGQRHVSGVTQSRVSLRHSQVTRGEAASVNADESADPMNDEFTTESETPRAGGVTLEDFKIYTITRVNPFRGAFEKAFKELKNGRTRPVK